MYDLVPNGLRGIVSTVSNNTLSHVTQRAARELRFPKKVKKIQASRKRDGVGMREGVRRE